MEKTHTAAYHYRYRHTSRALTLRRALAAAVLLLAASFVSSIDGRSRGSTNKQEAADNKYPLTPLGRSLKRVIFAAMLPGVCKSHDWRGEVPKYFARFLNVPVINWDARKWRYGRDDGGQSVSCRMCRNPSTADRDRKQPYRTDCSVISTKGIGEGDLVVVVGTGTPGCAYVPELRYLPQCSLTPGQKESFLSLHALDQLWDKRNTLKVHFPVRNLVALSQQENIFGFDHIVPDNSFFKPMGEKGGLLAELSRCYRNDKLRDLLYVARYEEYKGQLKFVQQADPALLHGFTIHFYGGGGEAEYMQRVTEAAAARGIQVKLHTRVSKRDLMSHSCKAAGQIMWSKFDNNPRAAYEGLYVGMPLFISTTAGVPAQLLEQRFVTPVDWNSDVAHFNTQLAAYMRYVKGSLSSRRMRRAVVEYTKTALNPDNVYWEICERVGVCAHRDVIQGVVDGDDGFDGTESSFLNGTARARGPAQPAGVHNMRPFQRAWGATMGETAGEM